MLATPPRHCTAEITVWHVIAVPVSGGSNVTAYSNAQSPNYNVSVVYFAFPTQSGNLTCGVNYNLVGWVTNTAGDSPVVAYGSNPVMVPCKRQALRGGGRRGRGVKGW